MKNAKQVRTRTLRLAGETICVLDRVHLVDVQGGSNNGCFPTTTGKQTLFGACVF